MLPPPTRDLDPIISPFNKERLFRVHQTKFRATEFNPGTKGNGRFHPIYNEKKEFIPTLYASDQINGALAETIFRDTLIGDPVYHSELILKNLSRLSCKIDLDLIDLTGFGLNRIGLTSEQLFVFDVDQYAITARWAEALHAACPNAHGMQWQTVGYPKALSILLFGDRVKESQLEELGNSELLYEGNGFKRILKAASLINATIIMDAV